MKFILSLKRISKIHLINFSSFFVTKIFSSILFLLSVRIFLNNLSAEMYGIVSYILLLIGYIQLFDLGVNYVLHYRLSKKLKNRVKEKQLFYHIQSVNFVIYLMSLILMVIGLIFPIYLSRLLFGHEWNSSTFYLLIISLVLLFLDSVLITILRSFNKIYLINTSQFIYDILRALILIVAGLLKFNLQAILLCFIIVTSIKYIFDLALVRRKFTSYNFLLFQYDRNEFKINIKFGTPMLMVLVIAALFSLTDKYFITHYYSLKQMAYYNLSTDVNNKAYFIIYSITGTIITPMINMKVVPKKILFLLLLIPIGIFVVYYLPLNLFSKNILELWLNKDFMLKSYRLVKILTWSSLFYMISAIFYLLLQSRAQFKLISLSYLCSYLLYLIVLIKCSSKYGLEGIAYANVFLYFSVSLFLISCCKIKKII